jgi:hypothetical protein
MREIAVTETPQRDSPFRLSTPYSRPIGLNGLPKHKYAACAQSQPKRILTTLDLQVLSALLGRLGLRNQRLMKLAQRRLNLALSLTPQPPLAMSGLMRLADAKASQERPSRPTKPTAAALPWTDRRAGQRPIEHAVVLDAQGIWAWNPRDPHAAAQRHESLARWVEKNPHSHLRVFVSGLLVHSVCHSDELSEVDEATARGQARQKLIESHGHVASNWPLAAWGNSVARGVCALAGINLKALTRHASRHEVTVKSVEPWWHHAFEESKRCVSALKSTRCGHVCVVEGQQIAWITSVNGVLAHVRQIRLATPTLSALCAAMQEHSALTTLDQTSHDAVRPVVLGHGITDGARTRSLDAIVLGRLDGEQPPQWLRPSHRNDFH